MIKTSYKGYRIIYNKKSRSKAWVCKIEKGKVIGAEQLSDLQQKIDRVKKGKSPETLTKRQIQNRVVALLKKDRFIDAIKLHRDLTGDPLMESKLAVEKLKEKL